jgi:hypothetical protein
MQKVEPELHPTSGILSAILHPTSCILHPYGALPNSPINDTANSGPLPASSCLK